jgi:peptidoglycan/xylan/chitin deacetylase (PgdA/CDA1 family)
MKKSDIRQLRRIAQNVKNRFMPRAMILLYHRVAELQSDPQLLSVSPQHFCEHLEVLRKYYKAISLKELVEALHDGNISRNSFVITFDDGYADNLYKAKPLLESYNIPATFFVTTGYIGRNREFWWDELENVMLGTPELPDQLTLEINGQTYCWQLEKDVGSACSDENWHVLMPARPKSSEIAYRELAKSLRIIERDDKEALLAKLFTWAGLNREVRPDYRALGTEEVRMLADGGLVEVGAHTMTHPVLSSLTLNAQRVEIARSKQKLEEMLNLPVTGFSYPFGGRGDFTTETVRLVRDIGFNCACSNYPGYVRWGTDPFELPRFLVRDWDGDEFAQRLEDWLAS